MSTATITRPTPPARTVPGPSTEVTFTHLVRSEWIKLWSIRSTWWSLGLTLVAMVGMAAIMAAGMKSFTSTDVPMDGLGSDVGLTVITFGYILGQVTVAVLGALVVTGEYSTGMIRSTFSAAPRRLDALSAKATVLAVVVFAVGFVATLISYVVTLPILDGTGMEADLADGVTWRVIAGNALYLTLVALFALALGVIIRSSAGTIAAALGVLLMLPMVFQILASLNQTWAVKVMPYLPSSAGERLMITEPGELDWWSGGLVLLGYVVLLAVIGAVFVKRRDA